MASNAVTKINAHVNSITCPDALRALPAWVCWRFESHEGEAKPRKIPYYASGAKRHGVQGSPADRAQLTTFDAAKTAAAKRAMDGVGFCPMPEFGIVALDFDHCIVDGGLDPQVEQLVAGTYAEFSPSGEGVRAFMRGALGNNKSAGKPWGFETFSAKGFVTVTGNALDTVSLVGTENTIAPVTAAVQALCSQRFGAARYSIQADPLMDHEPTIGLTPAQIDEALDVLDPDLPHQEWLQVGMALHHETGGSDAGFKAWDTWSSKGAKYPSERTLRQRWESFGRAGGRLVTARSLVKLARENGAYMNPEVAGAAEFDVLPPTDAKPPRFPVVQAGEFSRRPAPTWLVKGILPDAELIVLFGESGSGKSFMALDIVAAIARGIDWRGHKTRQGRVVYIAAEGGGGFRKRLAAYALHQGIALDDLPLGIIHAAPNFLLKADALDVVAAIKLAGGADLIVVDTFAQVMPGANENAGEDVGKVLAHCKGIHRATGAPVILVHHSGKDASKGARGWSGLRAAADAELEVVRTLTGRVLRVSKQKDGDDTGEWGFDLQVVPIGQDEDGDVVDSCVVIEAAVPVRGASTPKRSLGAFERAVFEVVNEIGLSQTAGIEVKAVVDEVVRRSPMPDDGKRDTRKQRATRALATLCDGDDAPFFMEDGCVSIL